MNIRCNHVFLAAIFIVFVVTSVNARNVRQNPGKSIDTTGTITIKLSEPANNPTAMTPINGKANHATSTTSIEGTAAAQAVKIANVEKVTENQTEENRILIKREIRNKRAIVIKPVNKTTPHPPRIICPKGYTATPNGDCRPKFVEN